MWVKIIIQLWWQKNYYRVRSLTLNINQGRTCTIANKMTESGMPRCPFHITPTGMLSFQICNYRNRIFIRGWRLCMKCLINQRIENLIHFKVYFSKFILQVFSVYSMLRSILDSFRTMEYQPDAATQLQQTCFLLQVEILPSFLVLGHLSNSAWKMSSRNDNPMHNTCSRP